MAFVHHFDPTVLREYDIRGVAGQTLRVDDAFAVGRTFGAFIAREGGHTVAVARDGRLSSSELEAAVVRGLRASGMEAIRIGLGPTPLLYFASTTLATDGAVMVTGSHNPPDENGFKLMLHRKPFFGERIRALGLMAEIGDVGEELAGSERSVDVSDEYLARVIADWDGGDRALDVVWDNGNGAAGPLLQRLIASLPGTHTILFGEVDGTFPNHHPDPTVRKNVEALAAEVRMRGARLGIAFDGDADRIGVVDNTGATLVGDLMLLLLARDVLTAQPGATIIADVKGSQVLFDGIALAGGTPLMWKTGHSLIKAKMAETGAKLGGEMSGHVFFADKYFGFDDALYAAVRLLGVVARMEGSVSSFRASLPATETTPELRFSCDETRKFGVVSEVAARLSQAGAEVATIDGVRVRTDDGWWMLRASNTQAALTARCEASSAAGLARLKAALVDELAKSGVSAPIFA